MDFDRLRAFYQVACDQSITKAAQALGVDKSSISRQLKQLEKELGQALLVREGSSLSLTPKGRFLMERARQILTDIEATRTALQTDQQGVGDVLRISTTHALITTWLSYFISDFLEEHSQLRMELYASNEKIRKSLQYADVAIRPFCPNEEWLVQTHLKRWRLCLYATPRYFERFGMPKSMEDLEQHRILMFHEPSTLYPESYTKWPLRLGAKMGRARRPYFISNNLPGIANLVRSGTGIGFLARNSPLLRGSGAVEVLADTMYQDVDAFLIYPQEYQHLGNIRALGEFLIEKIRNGHDEKAIQEECYDRSKSHSYIL